MKPFIQDGHSLALRAIRAALGPSEARLVIEEIATVDWASATFVGKRHRCDVRIEGAPDVVTCALARLSRDLPEVDVATNAYFLADISVCAVERVACDTPACAAVAFAAVTIEALTIEV